MKNFILILLLSAFIVSCQTSHKRNIDGSIVKYERSDEMKVEFAKIQADFDSLKTESLTLDENNLARIEELDKFTDELIIRLNDFKYKEAKLEKQFN